jgi:hypothetical protein
MAAFGNNKRAVESILIAKDNRALVNATGNGAALPGGGTRSGATGNIPLMSTVNNAHVNLFDGQLGIFCASPSAVRPYNGVTLSTDTFATVPAIYIAQGTGTSQKPGRGSYPLTNNRPYETSGIIYGHNPIIMSGKAAFYPTFSTWIVGETGAINADDLTEYATKITFRGYAQDVENPVHGYISTTYTYTTPDYTALGTVAPIAHLVHNMVCEINRNSRVFRGSSNNWGGNDPVIAMALDQVANGATDITAGAYDNGGSVNIVVRGGITLTYTFSTEQIASLRTAMPAGYGIRLANKANAGASANADMFLLMAVDRDIVFDDRVPQTKIRLDVGLLRGFDVDVVSKEEVVNASEGEGGSRQWILFYENTAGQRKYSKFQRQEWPFIDIESSIVEGTYYNVIVLEHRSVAQVGIAEVSDSPKKTIILVPACDDTTMTSLLTYLNTWVRSCPANFVQGTRNATTGALEVAEPSFC